MQTFLPFPDYVQSAQSLDNQRLWKQCVECKQIYKALTMPDYGWKNHPAVKMWKGYEWELLIYALTCCLECTKRGIRASKLFDEFYSLLLNHKTSGKPKWLGNAEFHRSHQSNLIRKDAAYYAHQFPGVPNNLEYVWPTP